MTEDDKQALQEFFIGILNTLLISAFLILVMVCTVILP